MRLYLFSKNFIFTLGNFLFYDIICVAHLPCVEGVRGPSERAAAVYEIGYSGLTTSYLPDGKQVESSEYICSLPVAAEPIKAYR